VYKCLPGRPSRDAIDYSSLDDRFPVSYPLSGMDSDFSPGISRAVSTRRVAMADIAFKMAMATIAFKMVVVTTLRRVISKVHLMKMQGLHHSVGSTRIFRRTECRAIQEQAEFMRSTTSSSE
jgi:hypothetical protein